LRVVGIQAMRDHAESTGDLRDTKASNSHLFYRFDLKFFWISFATHKHLSLC